MPIIWLFVALAALCVSAVCTLGWNLWLLLVFMGLYWRIYYLKNRRTVYWTVGVCLLTLSFSLISDLQPQTNDSESFVNSVVELDPSSLRIDGDQWRACVKDMSTNEKWLGTYYLKSEKEKDLWTEGLPPRYLRVKGELSLPRERRHLGGFDYSDYLKSKNIFHVLAIQDLKKSFVRHEKFSFSYAVSYWRYQITEWIKNHQPTKLAEYTLTLLLADMGSLSADAMDAFKEMGVIHLLAVSGFHISYFIRRFRHFLWRMHVTRETTDYLLCLFLPILGFLLGWRISVFRAISQSFLTVIFRIFGKKVSSIDSWSLSLIMAIWLFPSQWTQMGFQLTYLLSAVLIISQEYLQKFSKIHGVKPFVQSLLCLLFSIPVLSYHLFEFKPWSLFVSVLLLPFFTTALLPMLIAGLFFTFISLYADVFGHLLDFLEQGIHLFEQFMQGVSGYFDWSWITGRWSFLLMFVFYAICISALCHVETDKKVPKIYGVILLFIFSWNHLSPFGIVAMIDVGQGDCLMIKAPFSAAVTLIDTGGRPQFGEREPWQIRSTRFELGRDTVVPALKYFGVSSIERLIITHADFDHCGELLSVANALPVRELIISQQTSADERFSPFLKSLSKKKMPLQIVHPYQKISTQFYNLHFLAPIMDTKDANRDSIVIWSLIGGERFLLMGDGDKQTEATVIKTYPHLQADILKIGHHGSRTSTSEEFLDQLQVEKAWISAGENNRYNHPHKEVIQALEKRQIHIKRTDLQGSVYYFYLPHPWSKGDAVWHREETMIEGGQ